MNELKECFSDVLASEDLINAQVAIAMKQICESAKIGKAEFESAFTGISYATWRNYLNPSYKCSRSVAVVAALSWYTGISMHSFPMGEKLLAYLGITQVGLRLTILMSQLQGRPFEMACQMAYGLLPEDVKDVVSESYLKTRVLHAENLDLCPFPKPLNVHAFSTDYKRSCAMGACRMQKELGYSDARMAEILGVSEHRYVRISDPEDELPISAYTAVRFRTGFQLEDTTFMLSDMTEYPAFVHMRRYQEERDRVIRPLIENLTPEASERLRQALLSLFW